MNEVSLPQYMSKLYHGVEKTCGTFVVSREGISEDELQYTVKDIENSDFKSGQTVCLASSRNSVHLPEQNALHLQFSTSS